MKASELRIGNWVNFIGGEAQIEKGEDIWDIDEGTDKVEPIPLTEEWLLKFGFGHYKGEEGTYQRYIDVENGFTTIEYVLSDGIVCIDLMSVKCEYVHQLQNLYFALTGEELSIK